MYTFVVDLKSTQVFVAIGLYPRVKCSIKLTDNEFAHSILYNIHKH